MKRILFWSLLVAFIIAIIFWTAYTPRSPQELLRAVPAEAQVVAVIDNPAAQLDDVLANPFIETMILSSGVSSNDLTMLKTDPTARQVMELLFGQQCTLAYLPASTFAHTDIWVFTDWLGSRATAIRTALNWKAPLPLRKLDSFKAYPIYEINLPEHMHNTFVRFTFVEGGIIGTVSADPHALKKIINTYNRDDTATREQYREYFQTSALEQLPAKGWINTGEPNAPIRFALRNISANEIDMLWQTPLSQNLETFSPAEALTATTAQLFGNLPQLYLLLPYNTARQLLTQNLSAGLQTAFRDADPALSNSTITAALLGDEYCGRVKLMKFPTLVLNIPVAEDVDATQYANQYIDKLNATYKLGLVPETIPVAGGRSVYSLQGTSDNGYSKTPPAERIAYAVISNQIILASGTPALTKLIARYDRDEAREQAAQTPCASALAQFSNESTGCLCVDLVSGAKSLRLALIAYAMKLMTEDPANADLARNWLTNAQAWTDALEPMQHLTINTTQTNALLTAQVRLGPVTN